MLLHLSQFDWKDNSSLYWNVQDSAQASSHYIISWKIYRNSQSF